MADSDNSQITPSKDAKKFADLGPEIQISHLEIINKRASQLYDLTKEFGLTGVKYLFYTNAGGAVAVLSFIGTANPNNHLGVFTYISLGCFTAGVIFLLSLFIELTLKSDYLLADWHKSTISYINNETSTWNEIIKKVSKVKNISWWERMLALVSFICFIIGCIIGVIALLSGPADIPSTTVNITHPTPTTTPSTN